MLKKLNRGAVHPDETNLTRNGGGGGDQTQNLPMIRAFLPNQQNLLAQQLAAGFGGGQNHWMNRLGNIYSPMQSFQPFDYNPDKEVDTKDGGNGGHPVFVGNNPDSVDIGDRGVMAKAQAMQAAQQNGMAPAITGLLGLNPQALALIRQMQIGGR